MTIRRLGTLGFGLYGSRTYVESRPDGCDNRRFDDDRIVGWCETYNHLPAAQWVERALRGRAPVVATTTLSAQLAAAKAGLGLAVLPHFLGREHDLVCLQAELGVDQEIWLAIHSDLAQSRRVRAVAGFLVELIQSSKPALERP